MTRYAVLLRGINVGGARMTMVELRAALAPLPLGAVATVLATGNVVGTFDGDAEQLGVLVEQALSDAFGYDARVVVVAATRLAALLEACPYPPDAPGTHTYLTFARDPSVLDELAVAVAAQDPAETATRLGPEVVAWQAPVGGTLSSPRSKISSRLRTRTALTDRNLRTMIAVLAALDTLGSD